MINFEIGKFDQIASTNAYFKKRIEQHNDINGKLIYALEQTDGKGYGSNSWHSLSGKNLLFSFGLKPDFLAAQDQFLLSMMVSLSLFNTLSDYIPSEKLSVKWPNDLFYEEKKIAGILIDHGIQGNAIEYSIIGIGLNVNEIDFPSYLPNPISMRMIQGRSYDLEEILHDFIRHFQSLYEQNMQWESMKELYLKHLFRFNKSASYRYDGDIKLGNIQDIDRYGQLVVAIDGVERTFGFKEIEFIY